MTRLYIDDERNPPSRKWEVARSQAAVEWYLDNIGTPLYISFDHDLGDQVPSGYDIARMMVDRALDGRLDFAAIKQINVHSANGVGAENIRGLFSSYFRFMQSEGITVNMPIIT